MNRPLKPARLPRVGRFRFRLAFGQRLRKTGLRSSGYVLPKFRRRVDVYIQKPRSEAFEEKRAVFEIPESIDND